MLGNLDAELRAKLLLAGLLDLQGKYDKSIELAQKIKNTADTMRYARIARIADGYISGKDSIRHMREEMEQIKKDSADDEVSAYRSDEELMALARGMRHTLRLPEERLPVLARDLYASREAARERVEWCRHIGIIQDLRHTWNPETLYSKDPMRRCICSEKNYLSLIESVDYELILRAFKKAYCNDCDCRQPGRLDRADE